MGGRHSKLSVSSNRKYMRCCRPGNAPPFKIVCQIGRNRPIKGLPSTASVRSDGCVGSIQFRLRGALCRRSIRWASRGTRLLRVSHTSCDGQEYTHAGANRQKRGGEEAALTLREREPEAGGAESKPAVGGGWPDQMQTLSAGARPGESVWHDTTLVTSQPAWPSLPRPTRGARTCQPCSWAARCGTRSPWALCKQPTAPCSRRSTPRRSLSRPL